MRKTISLMLAGLLLMTPAACFAQAAQPDSMAPFAANQKPQSSEQGTRRCGGHAVGQAEQGRSGPKPCPPNTAAQARFNTPTAKVEDHQGREDRVEIRLNSGEKLLGKITAVREREFELTTRKGVKRQIADSDVKNIRKKNGFWRAAKGVAMVPVWIVAAPPLALLLWLGCRKGCDL